MSVATAQTVSGWKSTACILCECNCGIEVQPGGEDGRSHRRSRHASPSRVVVRGRYSQPTQPG